MKTISSMAFAMVLVANVAGAGELPVRGPIRTQGFPGFRQGNPTTNPTQGVPTTPSAPRGRPGFQPQGFPGFNPGLPVPAPQPTVVFASRLLTFNIDRREPFQNIQMGSVSVDFDARREVTLNLQPAMNCPAGRVCAAVMPEPIVITLPIITDSTDRCGSRIVTALRDLRPVDGSKEMIEVIDNTHNRCPHVVRQNATDVIYHSVPARFSFNEERVSTFTGTQIQRTLLAVPVNGPFVN